MEDLEKSTKDWQHGYDIEYLKDIEKLYENYNKYSLSPFSEYKKNNIAEDLHLGRIVFEGEGSYTYRLTKVRKPITMYQDVAIGIKEKGDVVITNLRGTDTFIANFCEGLLANQSSAVWLYVWAEDFDTKKIIEKYLTYVGSKITSFGEIYSVFFKDTKNALFPREHPNVDASEHQTIKKLGYVDVSLIDSIRTKLNSLDIKFQNHYSNYNKKKSWSAISLRGYTPDIMRIEKPIEMNDKWKEEHINEKFELQDTYLREHFSEVDALLSQFGNLEIHRIRFMSLTPGGGELTRHTDQVDPDSGGSIGKLARIHFPITTNPKVEFGVWEPTGNKKVVNMKEGEVWFLDTRKPHTVVNNGDTNRIHLVVDVVTNKKLRESIIK
jgi:hypothetical protein